MNPNEKEYEEWKRKKLSVDIEEEPEETEDTETISFRKEIWSYIRTVLGVVIIVVLAQMFLIVNARIPSASMEDTVMAGDQIFGNRLSYKTHGPERYDIVIFRYPDDPDKLFIKRVIGLPGETVHIKDGKVFIGDDTQPLTDTFCPEKPLGQEEILQQYSQMDPDGTFTYEVPADSYFMMGDNRNNSNDSRFWTNKYVSEDAILGKAFLRYWPLNRISLLSNDTESYYYPY